VVTLSHKSLELWATVKGRADATCITRTQETTVPNRIAPYRAKREKRTEEKLEKVTILPEWGQSRSHRFGASCAPGPRVIEQKSCFTLNFPLPVGNQQGEGTQGARNP